MNAHSTRSGVPDPGLKLTYDDFLLFPDDGMRHELIDGEHYLTPSPNVRHQAIPGPAALLIGTWLQAHPAGQIFVAPLDGPLLPLRRRRTGSPLRLERTGARTSFGSQLTGAPGPRHRDRIPRHPDAGRDDQAAPLRRSSVIEDWVVDPDVDVIRIYRRSGDRFERPVEFSRETDDVVTTALLPSLEIPLARVFTD